MFGLWLVVMGCNTSSEEPNSLESSMENGAVEPLSVEPERTAHPVAGAHHDHVGLTVTAGGIGPYRLNMTAAQLGELPGGEPAPVDCDCTGVFWFEADQVTVRLGGEAICGISSSDPRARTEAGAGVTEPLSVFRAAFGDGLPQAGGNIGFSNAPWLRVNASGEPPAVTWLEVGDGCPAS